MSLEKLQDKNVVTTNSKKKNFSWIRFEIILFIIIILTINNAYLFVFHFHTCELFFVVDPSVSATCFAPGKTEGRHCRLCGKILSSQIIIPKLIHRYCFSGDEEYFFDNISCCYCGEECDFQKPQQYTEEIENDSRFLALGFDDFRGSDFSLILPLFKKYGAKATFNKINYALQPTETEYKRVSDVLSNNCELGDHTFLHLNYIFNDPLINGQNPNNLEGNQKVFPTNEEIRGDRGDGKNVFGISLSEDCDLIVPTLGLHTTWENLTDEDCQYIRESFSIYCDKSGFLELLDTLSNEYLGTSGNSFGSWDESKQCYVGGIFTGCKTSANHEIWESILKVSQLYFINKFNIQVQTWSYPGGYHRSPFYYEDNGFYYYDKEMTNLQNYESQFYSSSNNSLRSWNDCLKKFGYTSTHDTIYPSRVDGTEPVYMSYQFIMNAFLSRNDAIAYSTNKCVSYLDIASEYNQQFFENKSTETEQDCFKYMYEDESSFYKFIEYLRHGTSNGLICGEVIDSEHTLSEYYFIKGMLEYCKVANIKLITKAQAYDICFNNYIGSGNLIHNKEFVNTIKMFLPNANNVPKNPDGYIGDCEVINDEIPTLHCHSSAEYKHYGIPYGEINYGANIKGNGEIKIYAIKNNTRLSENNEDLYLLNSISINSAEYKDYSKSFEILDCINDVNEKVMGIKIVYAGDLKVRNIVLEKTA
ncbi:MAG: polysaccharide deacetylase family protein [Clostridia bacterium]|nr:polysaccharide deacetylase family protein [Clostridia bacterium]